MRARQVGAGAARPVPANRGPTGEQAGIGHNCRYRYLRSTPTPGPRVAMADPSADFCVEQPLW
ncbi:hypothetical protein GCM10009799_25950 [Nocardiopsis rhodophaea]|uniref:Uncharacterized protein n=1 Tax=Nocardiopsis rhodophaea TaxID=280238 RepID=A0ABP5EJV0_9ACTN